MLYKKKCREVSHPGAGQEAETSPHLEGGDETEEKAIVLPPHKKGGGGGRIWGRKLPPSTLSQPAPPGHPSRRTLFLGLPGNKKISCAVICRK